MENFPSWSTEDIKRFYSDNRIEWHQLYKSQKKILEKIDIKSSNSVLDLGCACAGLYKILNKKYLIKDYTGIDINLQCINYSKELYKDIELINADVSDPNFDRIKRKFDLVISFGFIDCSNFFYQTFDKIINYVDEKGLLIFDLRVTNKKELIDINKSYQYLNYNGKKIGEKIPYNVLNIQNFTKYLNEKYKECDYFSYGYNLKPSANAILEYDEICFSTWIFKKNGKKNRKLELPNNLKF